MRLPRASSLILPANRKDKQAPAGIAACRQVTQPRRQGTAVERTLRQHIGALPDVIAGEVRQWVKVIRGQGRRAHQELPFSSVRSYLNCFRPVLAEWGQHVTSTTPQVTPLLHDLAVSQSAVSQS